MYDYLAERKGWTLDYTKKVHQQLEASAKEVGLQYDFDRAIPANSFKAHRFSHLAATHNLQGVAEERLFSAYFTEGKNIDDAATLVGLGEDIGIPTGEVATMLEGDEFSNNVRRDLYDAQQVGVTGVPFFVLGNKFAVSGAQPPEIFLEALQKAYQESSKVKREATLDNTDGPSCTTEGDC